MKFCLHQSHTSRWNAPCDGDPSKVSLNYTTAYRYSVEVHNIIAQNLMLINNRIKYREDDKCANAAIHEFLRHLRYLTEEFDTNVKD